MTGDVDIGVRSGDCATPNTAIVEGQISGELGQLQAAFVAAAEGGTGFRDAKFSTEAIDGAYRLSLPRAGAWLLICHGVGHQRLELPIVINAGKVLRLDIRLAVAALPEVPRHAVLILNGRTQYGLPRHVDGRFRADIAVTDDHAYVELNTDRGPIDVLGALQYRLQDGRVAALLPVRDGRLCLVLNPEDYPYESGEPRVEMPDSPSNARLIAQNRRFNERVNGLGPSDEAEWPVRMASLIAAARVAARAESELVAADYLNARALVEQAAIDPDAAARDASTELRNIPVWTLAWTFVPIVGLGLIPAPSLVEPYLRQLLSESTTTPSMQAACIRALYGQALIRKDRAAMETCLERLQAEHPQSRHTREVVRNWRRITAPGTRLAKFQGVSLDGNGKTIKNADFLGDVLLIVMWSISCPYCVRSMPQMHELYEKHRAEGFDILGITSERNLDSVREFRQKWPMPWRHLYVDKRNPQEPVLQALQLFDEGVPTFILVDRKGIICQRGSGIGALQEMAAELPALLPKR